MDEVESVPIPDEVGILGGAFMSDGSVILWSEKELWTHSPGQRRLTRICRNLEIAPRYAVASREHGYHEVFDSASHRVLKFRTSQRCAPRFEWQASGGASLVGHTADSWMEVIIASSSRLIVRGPNRKRRDSVVAIPFQHLVRFGAPKDYMISAADSALLITEIGFPYRTLHLTSQGGVRIALDPAAQLTPQVRADVLTGWESLRVLPLDDWFIQVLADPRSDRRRILVLDAGGHIVRSTLLDVAIGVMDAEQRRKRLIVLRNVGRSELVYYRWRWRT